MARSVAPSSSAPASDVTMPASNAATTSRPSTGSNPNKSGIHSVGIGALRDSARNSCGTTLFADSPPRCTQFGEKSALVPRRSDFEQLDLVSAQDRQVLWINKHFDAAGNARLSCNKAGAFKR